MDKNTSLIVALSAVAGGIIGALAGNGIYSGQADLETLEGQVAALRQDVKALKPEDTAVLDKDTLAVAISQGIDQHYAQQTADIRDEMLAKYEGALDEVDGDKWLYGDPDARFTLYEFADTQCSFCQRFHGTPKQLVDGSQGFLNWQYHHMTILSEKSKLQAAAGECAGELGGNKMFWVYMDNIYTNEGEHGKSELIDLAGQLGINEGEFRTCLDSDEMKQYIAEENSAAAAQGISGTPTSIIIDNKTGQQEQISGAQQPGAYVQIIRTMLEKETEQQSDSADS